MNGRCKECGEATLWDQELGSAICTHCGTLADPSQSILTSHLESVESSTREVLWSNVQGSTLKGRYGWALAGQGKEARDRKNTIAMYEYIQSIAARLSSPGSVLRAQKLFDQAMTKGHFRWGRKAKLVAGASIAIALREAHKSESLLDIAYLMDETPVSLSRAFTSVVSLLQLALVSADPTVHFPALQTHLLSLLKPPSSLPAKLITALISLIHRLPTVIRTATSLSALLLRTNTVSHLPTPPTACALFILAIEAESQSSIPQAGSLAQSLGTRLSVGKGVVMQRYKIVYDLVEDWIREVPWLDGYERKKGGTGRSKVAKRVVVARGLKDVVQFQEEIWQKKLWGDARPKVELELDEKDEDAEGDVDEEYYASLDAPVNEPGMSAVSLRAPQTKSVISGLPRKKQKTVHERSIAQASHFLLNPTSSAALSLSRAGADNASADLITHMLTADTSDLSHAFKSAPTRLQLLAASRGGVDKEDILDEELFAEGELEGIMRSANEVDVLRTTLEWNSDQDDDVDRAAAKEKSRLSGSKGKERKRREVSEDGGDEDATQDKDKKRARGSKRIDMDALARLLDPSAVIDENDEVIVKEHDGAELMGVVDGDEIVEEWRPLSPGGGEWDEDQYDF